MISHLFTKVRVRETVLILLLILVNIGIAVLAGWYIGYHRILTINRDTKGIQDFVLAYDLIKLDYYRDVSDDQLISHSLQALVASLDDPYSTYLSADQKIERQKRYERPALDFKILPSQIGYLQVHQFSPPVISGADAIFAQMKAEKIDQLIIDLRNNSGGDSESVIFLADQFLTEGIIIWDKLKRDEVIIEATPDAPLGHMEVVLLVNANTASAAENFAAALQGNGKAILIGQQTFGKGTIISEYVLDDGSGLNLTTGKWFTPDGKSIDGIGLTPNIGVEDVRRDKSDPVLEAAVVYFSD